MSELFAVQVTEVTATTASFAVDSVHPDSGPPAGSATFALMLMYDPIINSGYRAFSKYDHLEASPLAQAMDRDNYLDSRWISANAQAFVEKATVSRGGVVKVWPTHPAWIEHLRAGMAWDTAAYDGGPGARAQPRAPDPVGISERSSDPSAGFRVGAPKDEDILLEAAHIPLYGANRYLADPEITELAAMQQAAPALLGQPVLVVPKRGPSEVGTVVLLREGGLYLYSESQFGWGSSGHSFRDLRALGRAYLKVSSGTRPASEAGAKPAEKTTSRAGARTAAKKTSKAGAKKVSKAAAKTASKAGAKSTSKAAAKSASKAAAKSASKAAAKSTSKAAKKVSKTGAKSASKSGASKAGAKPAARKSR